MSFLELLKIEFMKVKRSKMIPLIFIAPLLVVTSGVATLQNYFSPEYTNAWAAMFIQSALVYAYYLLPFSIIVVCVMIVGRETGNNGILKMLALPISRYALSVAKFCVLLFYLFIYGNDCFSCCFCDNRINCNEQYRNYRSITRHVSTEVVRGIIFYDAPQCGNNVGNYDTI